MGPHPGASDMSLEIMTVSLATRTLEAGSGRRAALLRGSAVRSLPRLSATVARCLTMMSLGMTSLVAAASTAPEGPAAEGASASLPRQFSVEVAAGGVLFADGTRLGAASELERWAQRARSGARFAGATVFGDEERDGPAISEAIERLRRAGFEDVRRVGRPAPLEVSATRPGGLAPVVSAGKSPPPTSPVPSAPRPRAVVLATVGLHVDGALDKEPHRSRLVRVFEREFGAFRRCHDHAERHDLGASFGVDLLILKTGGRAKVRQTRTRLESKAFRTCMLDAFQAIRFAPLPSGRAEIVSYSVLFKPNAQ
jgi:hypothetical protein